MPIALAFVAGAVSVINPCGFALLPAFLAFYVGVDEDDGQEGAPSSLVVGLSVAAGFISVIAAIGVPIMIGARQLTAAIPWAGLVIGVGLTGVGVVSLAGKHIGVGIRRDATVRRARTARAAFMFGGAYAIASLGCTLPVLLALLASTLATAGLGGGIGVLAAYGAGNIVVVTALALGAGALRHGLARRIRSLVPFMERFGGVLLTIAGAYLSYYWGRVAFSSAATLADDPIVSMVQRWTGSVERLAGHGAIRWMILVSALVVVTAVVRSVHRRGRSERASA